MDRRLEFVRLAAAGGLPFTTLCAGFGISPKTGYKWTQRYAETGIAGLTDRSRRPQTSPRMTTPEVVALLTELVQRHPTWGGRKLHAVLVAQGVPDVPAPSTITAIIQREGLRPPVQPGTQAVTRFEADAPNDRWQLDFMGPRPLVHGRVLPLTLLDDHSRFALCLEAVPDQTRPTVQAMLTACFERYGLPGELLTDNGPPWGSSHPATRTRLEVWLMQLGITVSHGRPLHPQTQGKIERFNRSFKAEVCGRYRFDDLSASQTGFDTWRETYNLMRPHEALGMAVPANRYQVSPRPFPEVLPPIEYGPDDIVRNVHGAGQISYRNREWYVGQALLRQPVALRPTTEDGVLDVIYCHLAIRQLDLRQPPADAVDSRSR
jgi:transposase InsO family protein